MHAMRERASTLIARVLPVAFTPYSRSLRTLAFVNLSPGTRNCSTKTPCLALLVETRYRCLGLKQMRSTGSDIYDQVDAMVTAWVFPPSRSLLLTTMRPVLSELTRIIRLTSQSICLSTHDLRVLPYPGLFTGDEE
jgi:hypothetical protein